MLESLKTTKRNKHFNYNIVIFKRGILKNILIQLTRILCYLYFEIFHLLVVVKDSPGTERLNLSYCLKLQKLTKKLKLHVTTSFRISKVRLSYDCQR